MIIKYLQGSITIKGLNLPQAVVKCMGVHGSENDGAWVGSVAVYGNIETAISRADFWLEKLDMVIMMDGYQPNNVENKVNIFEYFLQKLQTMDTRFVDFEMKQCDHEVVFTSPASISPVLLDPIIALMNPHGAE